METKTKQTDDVELTHSTHVHLDTDTEIHQFLGYKIAVHSPLSCNRGKSGPAVGIHVIDSFTDHKYYDTDYSFYNILLNVL